MLPYSFTDTRELAPDVEDASDFTPCDSFGRDVDSFILDAVSEDSLSNYLDSLHADVDSRYSRTCDSASFAPAPARTLTPLRDVSAFAFGLLRDALPAAHVRALDMSARPDCGTCGASRIGCICPAK
jgi:hypothetical protein